MAAAPESLADELKRLEETLRSRGAAIATRLAQGADASAVRSALRQAGLDASDDVLTWFGWHNGTDANRGEPIGVVEIAPGAELCTLDQACHEYAQAIRGARELAAHAQVRLPAEACWSLSWLPMLRLFGKGYVAVDVDSGEVFLAWHDDEVDAPVPTWPTLAALARWITEQFATGNYRVDDSGLVHGMTIDRPTQ